MEIALIILCIAAGVTIGWFGISVEIGKPLPYEDENDSHFYLLLEIHPIRSYLTQKPTPENSSNPEKEYVLMNCELCSQPWKFSFLKGNHPPQKVRCPKCNYQNDTQL